MAVPPPRAAAIGQRQVVLFDKLDNGAGSTSSATSMADLLQQLCDPCRAQCRLRLVLRRNRQFPQQCVVSALLIDYKA